MVVGNRPPARHLHAPFEFPQHTPEREFGFVAQLSYVIMLAERRLLISLLFSHVIVSLSTDTNIIFVYMRENREMSHLNETHYLSCLFYMRDIAFFLPCHIVMKSHTPYTAILDWGCGGVGGVGVGQVVGWGWPVGHASTV